MHPIIKSETMNIILTKYFTAVWVLLINVSLLPTYAKSTLSTSELFRDNGDTVISPTGSFELGFFSPEDSSNRYVGIWYKRMPPRTVVWVANRDNPLTNTSSGMLTVIERGALVLLNAATNGSIIWSTNTSTSAQTPVARLLDSGNLIVQDASDEKNLLWQSFDYPTDTFLPGMKLGKNFVTGIQVFITSPKTQGNPASGDYTYHCDPTGYPQNELRKGGVVTYRTGPWNGKGFSGIPSLLMNPSFTYDMVINEKEVYYHYSVVNDSVFMRITLSETGVVQRWIWDERSQEWNSFLSVPADKCDIYNICGPYGSCNIRNYPNCECLEKFKSKDAQAQDRGERSNGCVRSTPLNCEKGDGFLKYSGVKLPDTRSSWYNKSMSLKECKLVCSRNCSCMAYASLDISRGGIGNGCLLWFGDLLDMRVISPGQDIYIRMASSELDSQSQPREILIVTLPLVIVLTLVSLSLLLCSHKGKTLDHHLPEIGRLRHNYTDNHPDQSLNDLQLPLFDLSTVTKATDNFSINNKLGQGGFGPVYKGRLGEDQEIAVKCLSRTSHQGVNEFKNEIICYAKLQHRNLVKILGCCIQGDQLMLVYEYMKNRSLDLILFDPTKRILLEWPRRFNIINGIARGIMYLHQDSSLRVIHRDLKASNILLDSDMNPKISDFGLAKTFGGNETGADTSHVVGTYGYMSPEYVRDGLFSVKSDVYSFGVIVLEIVSGERNRGFSHSDHDVNLLGYAWMLYREERYLELVDSCSISSCYIPEVVRSIHVGLLCVQEHPRDRPTMSAVVAMLSNDTVLPEAKPPGFFTGRDMLKAKTSVSSSSSINLVTNSQLEGR